MFSSVVHAEFCDAGFVDFFPSTRARAPGKVFSPARAVQYSTVLRAPCMYRLLHTKKAAGCRGVKIGIYTPLPPRLDGLDSAMHARRPRLLHIINMLRRSESTCIATHAARPNHAEVPMRQAPPWICTHLRGAIWAQSTNQPPGFKFFDPTLHL